MNGLRFGPFLDAKAFEVSASAGNLIGGHTRLNLNSGIEAQNGNLEAHILGSGGKIGSDGIEINTPYMGFHLCSIM